MSVGDTWLEVLRPQILDLAVVAAFLTLAVFSFFQKSVRLKQATFAFAVAYLGFVKGHLVSVVDVFALLDRTVPVVRYNLAWYAITVFVVLSTVLWGRLYCGRVCAFGALTQLLDTIIPARLRVDIPRQIEDRASKIKYGVLAGVVLWFLITRDVGIYRYVEPFWMFSLIGTPTMWLGLSALLVATLFIRNLYCRFLCPIGALLGLLSNLTVFRIKRWSECNTCKICEKTCQWGAIRGPRIVATECVRCDDCERLYLDQQKCPHWIILTRRTARGLKPVSVSSQRS